MFDSIRDVTLEVPFGWTHEQYMAAMNKVIAAPHTLTEEERVGLRTIQPRQVNPCDGCSVCCEAPSIGHNDAKGTVLKIGKPACKKCMFADNGCKVYDRRPDVCRDYLCSYALGDVPVNPKDCGVAWVYQSAENGQPLLVGHCKKTEEVVNNPVNRDVIVKALNSGMFFAVTVRDDKDLLCFTRDGWVDYASIDISDPMRQQINPKSIRQKVHRIDLNTPPVPNAKPRQRGKRSIEL